MNVPFQEIIDILAYIKEYGGHRLKTDFDVWHSRQLGGGQWASYGQRAAEDAGVTVPNMWEIRDQRLAEATRRARALPACQELERQASRRESEWTQVMMEALDVRKPVRQIFLGISPHGIPEWRMFRVDGTCCRVPHELLPESIRVPEDLRASGHKKGSG